MKFGLLCFATICGALNLLSACASLTARGTVPIWTGSSSNGLNATATCLVRAFDKTIGATHQTVIVEPDRILEVAPQQQVTIGAERYFARLSLLAPSNVKIDVFNTYPGASDPLKKAATTCS